MNLPELTPEQERAVAALVQQGWSREAAAILVLESTEDVIEDSGAAPPS